MNLAFLAELARQELGRDVSERSGTAEKLVNDAGEAWVNLFSWSYLREQNRTVQLVIGQQDYPLGAGIRSVGKHLHRLNSIYPPIPIVDYDTWLTERERYLSEIEYQLTPIATTSYGPGESGLEFTLHVFAASLDEQVVVQYQAGWLPLDKSKDVAMVPPYLHQTFQEWLRVYAMAREKPETRGDVAAATAQFMQSALMVNAKTADGEHMGRLVQAPGGAGAMMSSRGYERRRDALDHLRYHRPQ